MPKKHAMTAKRRAALKKAQLASARKRKGHGTAKATKRTAVPNKRKGMSGRKKAMIYGASLGAYMLVQNQKINYKISKDGHYDTRSGMRYNAQAGPHWLQFYGKGMSAEKQHRGFERHWKAHATPNQKADRHLWEMGYGQNNVTLTRMRPFQGQLALTSGRRGKRR